jgi:hypothetical protein
MAHYDTRGSLTFPRAGRTINYPIAQSPRGGDPGVWQNNIATSEAEPPCHARGSERDTRSNWTIGIVMKRLLGFLVLAVFALPISAGAQSLAEVAKKEEARRKTVKQTGKVYTNDNLKGDISKAPPPSAATPVPPPSTQVPSVNLPGGKVEDEKETKDQAYWSARINSARAALERSRIFADALQSRLNALNADIVNRDDPAQRAQLERERQRAVAELDRVKKEMAEQTKAIADIEGEARKAGVPPGWLRAG